MWVQDENGEWFDDGLPEEEFPEVPGARPFMPAPSRYDTRQLEPRGDRSYSIPATDPAVLMDARRKTELDKLIAKPRLFNNVSYETQPGVSPRGSVEPGMITGYGTRVMLKKPGESAWLTPGGAEASPEYVGDIQDIMGKMDRGEMSETQLKERIKSQEGRPPGPKPSEGVIDRMEFTKVHMTEKDPELQERAEKATREWENSIPYTSRALKPNEFNMKRAEVRKAFYNEYRNEELQILGSYITDRQKEEAAKAKSLVIQALEEKLGRDATYQEKQTAVENAAIRMTGAKAKATTEAKGTFKDWTPEAKEQEFTLHMITGKPPVSAAGLGGNDRQQYGKEYAQWKVDKGIRPQDVGLMQADYKSGDMSLRNMTKQEAPMEAFVGNINKQIDKVKQLYDNNDRTGLRLIDLPVRELKMRAVGSGDEAVKASYLLEISNEIGKLSSGASASVQQLSDSAKEDWKKVHDPNLSLSEIMKVVNATRDQANMRLSTWKAAKETVRNQIKSIGDLEGGINPIAEPQVPNKPKFIIKKVE